MMNRYQLKKIAFLGTIALVYISLYPDNNSLTKKNINKIIIVGAHYYPEETIKSKLPFKVGSYFNEEESNLAIRNIDNIGYFSQVVIETQENPDGLTLYITVTEKPRVEAITFTGNKNLSSKDINKKVISTDTHPAIDESELAKHARKIEKLYQEKGFNFTRTKTQSTVKDGKISVEFIVEEGPKTLVKKVLFKGNDHIPAKKLRSLLFTKEDWILGVLDRSGMYHPAAIDQDKMTIENFYQSNGYMKARVLDASVDFSNKNRNAAITFTINEGDFYTIDTVSTPGNEIYSDHDLKQVVPIAPGQPYSRELIRLSIENLKKMWGNKGYIHADIEPSIQPDDTTKKVSITFHSDLGKKVKLNRVTIKGNKKSRDRIVRRQLLVDEGEELTSSKLEITKERIKGLGFFDPREGVNWKISRIDAENANLEILLKEIKTGRFEFKMNYGGSPSQLSSSGNNVTAGVQFTERNLFGTALMAHVNLQGAVFGDTQRSINVGLTEPWLFDKPIRVGFDAHYEHNEYDEIRKVTNTIQEQRGGFVANIGYVFPYAGGLSVINQFGLDSFKLFSKSRTDSGKEDAPQASVSGSASLTSELQNIFNTRMKSGKVSFWQCDVGQDSRNHPVHPSQGHRWIATTKFGFPVGNDNFGFYKFQLDSHWYTPIINENDLVLHIHAHVGYVNSYKNHDIPFKELYNIGGPASVRGWTFGQLSPLWAPASYTEEEGWQGDPIGGRKAFFFNTELIFPVMKDMSIKAVVFYDGGSGWDTPTTFISPENLKNNSFDYRHSIGFGIRMINPQPIKIDWGFKLDKRPGESATEVSFSSYYDF
jgi:outer membrane protein insertion porin family